MARQYWFGPTPPNEEATQLTDPDYSNLARNETRTYVKQLYRFLQEKGYPRDSLPRSFRLVVANEPHDFGYYYEAVLTFDENDPRIEECHELGLLIDSSGPDDWDSISRRELGLK
jgi:hypothetical protein